MDWIWLKSQTGPDLRWTRSSGSQHLPKALLPQQLPHHVIQIQILLTVGWNKQGKESNLYYLLFHTSSHSLPWEMFLSYPPHSGFALTSFKSLEKLQTTPTLHWSCFGGLSLVLYLLSFSFITTLFHKSNPIFLSFRGSSEFLLCLCFAKHCYTFGFLVFCDILYRFRWEREVV